MSQLITDAIKALKNDEFIIYPTDTLYGLGICLTKKKNYQKLMDFKKRPEDKPNILVMFADIEQLKKYINLTKEEEKIINANKDRKFSFIIHRKLKKPIYSGEDKENTARFRISNIPIMQEIIRKTGPISATSANISNTTTYFSIKEIPEEIKKQCAVIIHVGRLEGKSSTLIDITERKIIRQGENNPVW